MARRKNAGEGYFAMILPKADNSGRKIRIENHKKYIERVNDIFGGSTTKPITLGCYKNPARKDGFQCESGFAVESFRDFDSDKKLRKLNNAQRIIKLDSDFRRIKAIAKDAANEYGQESIPAIFTNIKDVDLVRGKYREKIEKRKTGQKIKGDLFRRYI